MSHATFYDCAVLDKARMALSLECSMTHLSSILRAGILLLLRESSPSRMQRGCGGRRALTLGDHYHGSCHITTSTHASGS